MPTYRTFQYYTEIKVPSRLESFALIVGAKELGILFVVV